MASPASMDARGWFASEVSSFAEFLLLLVYDGQKVLRYGNYRMRPTGKAVFELILRLGLSLTGLAIALFLSGCSRSGQPSEGKSSPQLVRRGPFRICSLRAADQARCGGIPVVPRCGPRMCDASWEPMMASDRLIPWALPPELGHGVGLRG